MKTKKKLSDGQIRKLSSELLNRNRHGSEEEWMVVASYWRRQCVLFKKECRRIRTALSSIGFWRNICDEVEANLQLEHILPK